MSPQRQMELRGVARIAVAALALSQAAAPAWAASSNLPATEGELSVCHQTLFNVAVKYPVTVDFAAQKGAHPPASLLNCHNAQSVALAGKRYYQAYPFGVGKTVTVGKVTYTMASDVTGYIDGKPVSGPVYGWAGDGIVIYLINPSG